MARIVGLLACLLLATLAPSTLARLGGVCSPAASDPGFAAGQFLIRDQADMDALPAGCTTLAANVNIDCAAAGGNLAMPVVDVQVFQSVTEITGFLRIANCPQLLDLQGLTSLKVIQGSSLFSAPSNIEGFAVFINSNNALSTLGGLEGLEMVNGNGNVGEGRVSIESNNNLCFLDTIDWDPILDGKTDRLLRTTRATSCGAVTETCDSSCSCGTCFGPNPANCQGVCKDDDKTLLIVLIVVLCTLGCCLILLIVWCCCTGRCGCRTAFDRSEYQWGSVKSDLRPGAVNSKRQVAPNRGAAVEMRPRLPQPAPRDVAPTVAPAPQRHDPFAGAHFPPSDGDGDDRSDVSDTSTAAPLLPRPPSGRSLRKVQPISIA